MLNKSTVLLSLLLLISACSDQVANTSVETSVTDNPLISQAPAGAGVYIISPVDGEEVATTFTVIFGLSGMGIAPAGIEKENTGHHHILIDLEEMPDMSLPLPTTDNIKHFGAGQTETSLTLAPGEHTLQLLLGNHLHVPHQSPVMSKKITVTVK